MRAHQCAPFLKCVHIPIEAPTIFDAYTSTPARIHFRCVHTVLDASFPNAYTQQSMRFEDRRARRILSLERGTERNADAGFFKEKYTQTNATHVCTQDEALTYGSACGARRIATAVTPGDRV
ncbi:MAG: hypothetical protein IPK82_02345 [Polyangiaceae bacterium]|nr:hypothetical protein [Polyangiaceae bacterium]